MQKRLISLTFLLLCSLALPGQARARDRHLRCTAATAQATTIETIQAAVGTWEGRCVRIQGLGTTRRLCASRAALVDPIPYGETPTARSIVINPRNRLPDPQPPRWVELIGTVGRCITENAILNGWSAEHPDQIAMLSGYCHTSLENYVRPVFIRVLSDRPIPRLSEAEVPPEQRELVDAPEALRGRAEAVEAARSMLAAIQSRDEATFARLEDPELADFAPASSGGSPGNRRRDPETHRDFRAATATRSVFAGLASGHGQVRILMDRRERDDLTENPASGSPGLIACWCRTADCSGRWPVRALDADNDPARPYACVHINDYLLGLSHRTVVQAQAKVRPNGFIEPGVTHRQGFR